MSLWSLDNRSPLDLGRFLLNLGLVGLSLGLLGLSVGLERLSVGFVRLSLGMVRLSLGLVRLSVGLRLSLGLVIIQGAGGHAQYSLHLLTGIHLDLGLGYQVYLQAAMVIIRTLVLVLMMTMATRRTRIFDNELIFRNFDSNSGIL